MIIKNATLLVSDEDTPGEDLVFTIDTRFAFGKLVKYDVAIPHDMQEGDLSVDMLKKSKDFVFSFIIWYCCQELTPVGISASAHPSISDFCCHEIAMHIAKCI